MRLHWWGQVKGKGTTRRARLGSDGSSARNRAFLPAEAKDLALHLSNSAKF